MSRPVHDMPAEVRWGLTTIEDQLVEATVVVASLLADIEEKDAEIVSLDDEVSVLEEKVDERDDEIKRLMRLLDAKGVA